MIGQHTAPFRPRLRGWGRGAWPQRTAREGGPYIQGRAWYCNATSSPPVYALGGLPLKGKALAKDGRFSFCQGLPLEGKLSPQATDEVETAGRGRPALQREPGVVPKLRGTTPQTSRGTRGARQGTEQSASSNYKVAGRFDSREEPHRPNTKPNRASALFLSTGRDALLFGAAKRREGRRRHPVPPGRSQIPTPQQSRTAQGGGPYIQGRTWFRWAGRIWTNP